MGIKNIINNIIFILSCGYIPGYFDINNENNNNININENTLILNKIDKLYSKLSKKISNLETKISKFESLEYKINNIGDNIDKINNKFVLLETSINNINYNTSNINNKISILKNISDDINKIIINIEIMDELNDKIKNLDIEKIKLNVQELNKILNVDLDYKIQQIQTEVGIIQNYKNDINITGDQIVDMFIELKNILDEISKQMNMFVGIIQTNDFEKTNNDLKNFKLSLVNAIKDTISQRNIIMDFNKNLQMIQTYEEKIDSINRKINDRKFISNIKNINDLLK